MTLAWDPDAGTNIAGYKIYYGVASRTYSHTNNVGNVTNATISSLIGGTVYYFAATAVDTSGLESDFSAEVVYTNPVASAPKIVLSSPVSGANYTAPATISCAASVTANGHTITQVQFYNGATLLGTFAAAPYTYSWNNVSAGTYSLSATAVYDSGSTVSSAAAGVTVKGRKRPKLGINIATATTGAAPAVVPPPSPSITLNATGGDPGLTYNIQSSPDLNTWTQIGTMTLDTNGCCQFTNSVGASGTMGFYRLQGQ